MRSSFWRGLAAASLVVAFAVPAFAQDVEAAKKQIDQTKEYLNLGCPAKARASLAVAEKAVTALNEFEREKFTDDLRFLKEQIAALAKDDNRNSDRFCKMLDRTLNPAENAVEGAKSQPEGFDESFGVAVARVREALTDDDNQKLLGPETISKYERKIAWMETEFKKNKVIAYLKFATDWHDKIQEVLDGKNKNAYTNNVEDWFKWAGENLDKCGDDARAKELRAKVAKQRTTFDSQQAQGEQSEIVDPAVNYWKSCKDDYGKDAQGWEAEKTPSTLKDFLHHSPSKIGCDKTEHLLREVLHRWFDNDMTKRAVEKYPNNPALKAALAEATKLRDEAGGKVCAFVGSLLDEAEKMPKGSEREDAQRLLGELERVVTQETTGTANCDKTVARIKALDKRWTDETSKGAAAKEELEKKLTQAANEVWPGMLGVYASQVKKIDAAAAVENIGSWKGTVLHFTGGAKGVNMNRAGWNFEGDYVFVVEKDGVPICGNFDEGLAEGITAVEKTTGVQQDSCEECIGIVDGTCKVYERRQNPLDNNQYYRGRQLDAVRIRIVAWKACTVAACVGKGTNLQKLSEFKEVSVKEAGSSSSGPSSSPGSSGGSSAGASFFGDALDGSAWCWIKRLGYGFFSSFIAILAGALAIVHGAGKFVPSLPNLREKMGNGLGYAGIGITAFAGLWLVTRLVICDLAPAGALFFTGAFLALEALRARGTLSDDTAKTIQPLGILLGLGTIGAAFVHVLFWDLPIL